MIADGVTIDWMSFLLGVGASIVGIAVGIVLAAHIGSGYDRD